MAYYNDTVGLSGDVVTLSKDEHDQVIKAIELIKANKFISKFFAIEEENVEIHNQVVVYFRYMDEDCKAMMDKVYIDHNKKTIQIIDIKSTVKSVLEFEAGYLAYGYYRQLAFYELSVWSTTSPYHKLLTEEGYTLLDPAFIVVEKGAKSTHPAVMYIVDPADRACGLNGGMVNGKYYKGIVELILAYKFHNTTNLWDMSKELYDSQGCLPIKAFK